jgi:hypothetical protein
VSAGPAVEHLLDWVTEWPEDLLGKLRHAEQVVNWLLGGIPEALARWVDDIERRARELWQKIVEAAQKVFEWFRDDFLPGVLAPITLFRASRTWNDDVFSKVTDVHGRYAAKELNVDDYWHGPAARAYGQVITSQQEAANAVSETVNSIREALQNLSIAMGAAYVSLAALLALSTIEVGEGTATLFGVITIPAGLAAILVGVLTAAAAVGGFIAVMEVATQGALSAIGDLRAALNDNRALEAGAWPTPVAGLDDGSMTDGNRSGWTFYDDPTN